MRADLEPVEWRDASGRVHTLRCERGYAVYAESGMVDERSRIPVEQIDRAIEQLRATTPVVRDVEWRDDQGQRCAFRCGTAGHALYYRGEPDDGAGSMSFARSHALISLQHLARCATQIRATAHMAVPASALPTAHMPVPASALPTAHMPVPASALPTARAVPVPQMPTATPNGPNVRTTDAVVDALFGRFSAYNSRAFPSSILDPRDPVRQRNDVLAAVIWQLMSAVGQDSPERLLWVAQACTALHECLVAGDDGRTRLAAARRKQSAILGQLRFELGAERPDTEVLAEHVRLRLIASVLGDLVAALDEGVLS